MSRRGTHPDAGPAAEPAFETITTPEGTVYRVTPDGKARLTGGKAGLAPLAPHRIGPVPKAPKARRDRDVPAWADRLTATITRAIANAPEHDRERFASVYG